MLPAPQAHKKPGVKPWKSAGLILTYWCNCRCAICYLNCGPEQDSAFMSMPDALHYWKDLEALAGPGVKIHLSGGEAFGKWPNLLAILQAAQAEGLHAHEVETNAFWCTDRREIQNRCRQLLDAQVGRLVVSCDLYHQQYIPFERVRLLVQVARETLGDDKVRLRWRDFFAHPIDLNDFPPDQHHEVYRQAWQAHHDRLTGRAARNIAPLLDLHPAQDFVGQTCEKSILASGHVHIDPIGNIFPGVCSGIVLGNARRDSLACLWDHLSNTQDEILRTLVQQGPYGLLGLAEQLGYKPGSRGFAHKCQLCTEIRGFLFNAGKFSPTIGPAQCYVKY